MLHWVMDFLCDVKYILFGGNINLFVHDIYWLPCMIQRGSLPLHVAAQFQKNVDVIVQLQTAYPDGVQVKDNVRMHFRIS